MRIAVTIFFLLFVCALSLVAHRYLWLRLVRDTALTGPLRVCMTIAIVSMCTLMFTGPSANRLISHPIALLAAAAAFTWMGVMFYNLLSLGGIDLIRWGARIAGVFDHDELSLERRLFLQRSVGAGAAAAAALASGMALRNGRATPKIKHVEVKLSNLPAHLDGLKIVQISDLHVSATIRRPYVEQVVAMSNALQPDLVALTGDLMDGSVPQLRDEIAPLADLTSRYGSLFCTGNHEYYSGVEPWLVELRRIGIRTLRNEHVEVGAIDGASGLIVAGIDDAQAARFGGGHGPDVARALSGVSKDRSVVLLAHQPKSVHEAAEHAVDLQLSGHTHGGQIWPFGYLVRLAQPYVSGLHQHNPVTQIYVSRGTGYWGPPMRLGAPSEVTCLTLKTC